MISVDPRYRAIVSKVIEAGEPVNKKYIKRGAWEVEIAGVRYPAEVTLPVRPFYDPKMKKVRA